MTEPTIVLTGDGSHSVRSPRFGVEYHSIHGAIQESQHVFIGEGLMPLLKKGVSRVHLLEMGLGTGLNALLVRRLALAFPDTHFVYHALEQFPLPEEAVRQLNYPGKLGLPVASLLELHASPWSEDCALESNFILHKHQGAFPAVSREQIPDAWANVIFYDAFAPVSQPELWGQEALSECFRLLRPGGWLVTYCAKGQFKRNLKAVGFRVESPPGPPGKREMTRGVK